MLGGGAAIEKAAKDAGHDVKVPFTPGRMDASQEETDVESVGVLEPRSDGFRNYRSGQGVHGPEEALIDKAQLLKLTAPEMTVLVGGLRVLGANAGGSKHGVFTKKPGTLTNDFFVNLLDMAPNGSRPGRRKASTRGATGRRAKSSGPARASISSSARTRILRAIAEVYGSSDAKEKFVKDFAKAWAKVMNLDRFDLIYRSEPALKIAAE